MVSVSPTASDRLQNRPNLESLFRIPGRAPEKAEKKEPIRGTTRNDCCQYVRLQVQRVSSRYGSCQSHSPKSGEQATKSHG